MPRYVQGKTKISTKERRRRADQYRVTGNKGFLDPFPLGFGTVPEKMVYAALSKRRIPFYYLDNIRFIFPEIDFDKTYQADFILPDQRIIIEVNGAFWHSKPGTIDSDALKYAVYEQAGYRVLAWWDFDIISNVNLLFLADPQLAAFHAYGDDKSSELAPQNRTKTDTSKGIRTLNRKRGERLRYKKTAASIKRRKSKDYGSYASR